MEEKIKDEQKTKSYGSKEITDEILDFKKICDSRCSICNSGILHKIHEWRKNGFDYDNIVEKARAENNVKISPAGLSRHFKSYSKYKLNISAQIIKKDVLEEVTSQVVHMKKSVLLIDKAYAMIEDRIAKGLLILSISDLEKLHKIRYQIVGGENADDKDVMAIFQKAQNKYGLNLQQAMVFK